MSSAFYKYKAEKERRSGGYTHRRDSQNSAPDAEDILYLQSARHFVLYDRVLVFRADVVDNLNNYQSMCLCLKIPCIYLIVYDI